MPDRIGTSVGWWPRPSPSGDRPTTGDVDRACGRRARLVVFDWGEIGPLYVFCAVVAWSKWRFVSFADNLGAETTMNALAECFERLGGVPKTALTDRMGCLKGGTVAGLVIPTPAYVRFATHYDFRPDFCEGADPECKGLVENLVGYVKSDLMIPEAAARSPTWPRPTPEARHWCDEVNAVVHSEICAIPAERLVTERELFSPLPSLRAQIGKVVTRKVDRLSCVRFGSARYSVPTAHVGADARAPGPRRCDHRRPAEPRSSPSIWSSPLVRPRSTTTTMAGPGPLPRRAVRPQEHRREDLLLARAGRPTPSSRERRPRG